MILEIKKQIKNLLQEAGVEVEIDLVYPPKAELGDLALPCFALAKAMKVNPIEAAKAVTEKLKTKDLKLVDKIEAAGPYVNFYLNSQALADLVLREIKKQGKNYGKNNLGKSKKILVEFAQPNTHKAFHIGHLRGTLAGESLARILENADYKVTRVNYQGDVGMHIAKCLWGISQIRNYKSEIRNLKTIAEKVKWLGEAYAAGAKAFEESEKSRQEITAINEKIYLGEDKEIKKLYKATRAWSLAYFAKIYKRLGTKFDRFYFESAMARAAIEIVKAALRAGVLEQSQGAVIFAGSKQGLHDRVFLNRLGLPTYEAKDLALAEKQFKEFNPDKIIHVVAREQSEYFKVLFKVLEKTLPESRGREKHLLYGWVSLKSGKMSSRAGQVVLGEWLLDGIKKEIDDIMKDSRVGDKDRVAEAVASAAVKYAFLKTGLKNDINFDFKESVSLSGDSGPYLLYIVARIKSILNKSKGIKKLKVKKSNFTVNEYEKSLLLKLAEFPEAAARAARALDPSVLAQYLFNLAQLFNSFYTQCPILKAEKEVKSFRLSLIQAVEPVMERGLSLLGIKTVDKM